MNATIKIEKERKGVYHEVFELCYENMKEAEGILEFNREFYGKRGYHASIIERPNGNKLLFACDAWEQIIMEIL